MTDHTHAFAHWPFADPVSAATFCTGKVAHQQFPILLVTHDLDGDWQFLDDSGDELGEPVMLCLGCVFEKDATLAQIADLPRGWSACRPHVGAEWERWERADEDEEDEPEHACGDEEARERKALADIEQYGLQVISVREEEGLPPFAYSIGIQRSLGLPELIIVGMPGSAAHALINDIHERLKDGLRLQSSALIAGLLDGDLPCVAGEVTRAQRRQYMGWALWLYGGDAFEALQIVYPDSAGIYPWSRDASADFKRWQPLLGPEAPLAA